MRCIAKTALTKEGTYVYYKALEELLTFRGHAIEMLVIQKLKEDKSWKDEKEKFTLLLEDHYIFENFQE